MNHIYESTFTKDGYMTTDLLRSSIEDFARESKERHSAKGRLPGGTETVCILPLEALRKSPYQPRQRSLGKKDVAELVQSLAAVGQTTPLVVAPCTEEPG